MNLLGSLALVAFLIYLQTAIRSLSLSPESRLNRVVFAMSMDLSAWALCSVFLYTYRDAQAYRYLVLAVSVAWFLFVCLALHFCLLVGQPERRISRLGFCAIYAPGFLAALTALLGIFSEAGDQAARGLGSRLVMAGFFLYSGFAIAYLGLGLAAVAMALRRSREKFERKRLGILLASIAVPVCLGIVTDFLLPLLGAGLPFLGVLWCLLWVAGLHYDIQRYGFIAPVRNISDAGRLFSAFLARSQDGIVVTDADGRVAVWNSAMEGITGIEGAEAMGRFIWEIQHELGAAEPGHGYDAETIRSMVGTALLGESPPWSQRAMEFAIYDRSRRLRWLQSSAFVILMSGGRRCLAAIVRDLTEERRNSLAAQEERKRLERAEKVEAVGNLAAGLAHDFNNILTGIKGTVSVLRLGSGEGEGPTASELSDGFDLIEAQSARGSDLVRQLLALGRKAPSEMRPVALAAAVEHAIMLTKNSLDESVTIVGEEVPHDAIVMAEGSQIERVLINLILNAADSMTGMRSSSEPKGGRIFISVMPGEVTEGMLARRPGAASRYWTIAVRDEGVGIAEADLARVFDPFYTTKSDGKSHGLGLPTVYAIAESHGGFAEARSVPGQGSEFRVSLPVPEPTSDRAI
jgi:PAS domain S-box-containing protein